MEFGFVWLICGEEVKVFELCVMELLVFLVLCLGEMVVRDEIFEEVWGGVVVVDGVLFWVVYGLCVVFVDDVKNLEYLFIVLWCGY